MRISLLVLIAFLAACAAEPPRYGQVITMKRGEAPPASTPAPGTVWRLDEAELKALSPAPIAPAPPPPRVPPPRPNASYPWYPPPPPRFGAPPPPMY